MGWEGCKDCGYRGFGEGWRWRLCFVGLCFVGLWACEDEGKIAYSFDFPVFGFSGLTEFEAI